MTEITAEMVNVCFYCGGNAAFPFAYHPFGNHGVWSRTVMDTPCGACKAIMSIGVVFIEVDKEPLPGRVIAADNLYATGRWVVVDPNKVEKLVGTAHAERVLKTGHALVTIAQFKQGKLDCNHNSIH